MTAGRAPGTAGDVNRAHDPPRRSLVRTVNDKQNGY